MLRFLKYFSFSFSGCKSVVGCWVCLSMGSDCYLEGSIYFLFRKENVAFQEDLILNHKELFGVNTLLGQKDAWGFLIPALSLSPGHLFLCHPVLTAMHKPCCFLA